MKTANTAEIRRSGEWPTRRGGDLTHRGREEHFVSLPGVVAPALRAHGKDGGNIGTRRAGDPKRRHDLPRALCGNGGSQAAEIAFEISVSHLVEVAVFQRIDARVELCTKSLQPEAVRFGALLKRSEGVTNRLAGILVYRQTRRSSRRRRPARRSG